jgi:hypothetical protein
MLLVYNCLCSKLQCKSKDSTDSSDSSDSSDSTASTALTKEDIVALRAAGCTGIAGLALHEGLVLSVHVVWELRACILSSAFAVKYIKVQHEHEHEHEHGPVGKRTDGTVGTVGGLVRPLKACVEDCGIPRPCPLEAAEALEAVKPLLYHVWEGYGDDDGAGHTPEWMRLRLECLGCIVRLISSQVNLPGEDYVVAPSTSVVSHARAAITHFTKCMLHLFCSAGFLRQWNDILRDFVVPCADLVCYLCRWPLGDMAHMVDLAATCARLQALLGVITEEDAHPVQILNVVVPLARASNLLGALMWTNKDFAVAMGSLCIGLGCTCLQPLNKTFWDAPLPQGARCGLWALVHGTLHVNAWAVSFAKSQDQPWEKQAELWQVLTLVLGNLQCLAHGSLRPHTSGTRGKDMTWRQRLAGWPSVLRPRVLAGTKRSLHMPHCKSGFPEGAEVSMATACHHYSSLQAALDAGFDTLDPTPLGGDCVDAAAAAAVANASADADAEDVCGSPPAFEAFFNVSPLSATFLKAVTADLVITKRLLTWMTGALMMTIGNVVERPPVPSSPLIVNIALELFLQLQRKCPAHSMTTLSLTTAERLVECVTGLQGLQVPLPVLAGHLTRLVTILTECHHKAANVRVQCTEAEAAAYPGPVRYRVGILELLAKVLSALPDKVEDLGDAVCLRPVWPSLVWVVLDSWSDGCFATQNEGSDFRAAAMSVSTLLCRRVNLFYGSPAQSEVACRALKNLRRTLMKTPVTAGPPSSQLRMLCLQLGVRFTTGPEVGTVESDVC